MIGYSGSPRASRLTFRAAVRYWSSVVGDTNNSSATLSNPLVTLSAGRSNSRAIFCGRSLNPNRSRMAFPYSVRVRRRTGGMGPVLGASTAERSSSLVSHDVSASARAGSGCGAPVGGITPVCTFRRTFSQASGRSLGLPTSSVSSSSPAVLERWLWHVTQNRSMVCLEEDADIGGAEVLSA